LRPLFEYFFILGGPRGTREKNVKNLDSVVTSELVGIWIKFYLNPKSVILAFVTGSIQVMFPEKNVKN
jgi:hypothetical protein